jgi:short-subunit dehydrogenase
MHKYPVHPHGAVLITGTSTGIGYHAVFEVAKLNYTVFATVRGKEDLNSLVKEAKSRNLEKFVKPVIMDVTKSEEIREILEQISKFLQENNLPLVGIVNNAGISTRYPLEIQPLENARKVLDVNFFGAVDVTQRFLPLIRKYKGRILFISSMSGIASLPGRAIYSASKRAIEGLVDSLRLEMMPFEVSVTSLLPGYVKSEISNKLPNFQDLKPEEYELYKTYIEGVKKENEKNRQTAPGPEVTSEAIIDALTNPYPRTRYYMGTTGDFPPWLTALLSKLLPDPLIDYVKQMRYR